jgi:hypothetical protein
LTPKTRLIPLPPSFLDYLRSDGIVLPPDAKDIENPDPDYEDDDDDQRDPSLDWPETHELIAATIRELGGKVHPKLNWSAPKDATWIAATNNMECASPNDIYLLFKSSDFITHDLEQAFDGCEPAPSTDIPYHLVLRKSVPAVITSMEFRCFVRQRKLIGICQRDQNHYDFLESLIPTLQDLIEDFFEDNLRDTFPDNNFVFDVYVPQPKEKARVWLMDINPWAPRTDPLVFSWLELLTREVPESSPTHEGLEDGVVRLSIRGDSAVHETQEVEELPYLPEFRTIKRDDPEAYSFNTPLYSAHKLPKDVVDAGSSVSGEGGMRDFMSRWRQYEEDAANGRLDDSDDE